MKKLKVALFDLDGTLIDTEGQYTEIWGAIGRKYRPDLPDFSQVIKGTTLTQILDNYFPDKEIRHDVVAELDEKEAGMRYEFYDGALDFIADLRRHGVKCAIVTSSNKKKMESLKKQVPDFDDLFDRVLTSEDFTASKPNPDCYLLGARVFDAALDECVVFEDAFTGLQAGMSAGIFTIGLATCNSREAIEDKCNYVLDNFNGLTYDKIEEIRQHNS